jgi:hypothetical protein
MWKPNGHVRINGPWSNDDDFNIDIDDENGWDENVDYSYNESGWPYALDGSPADKWKLRMIKLRKIN